MNKKFNKTARRARSTTYKDISARLKKAFPDASQVSLREVIILRIQVAASAFEAGLKKRRVRSQSKRAPWSTCSIWSAWRRWRATKPSRGQPRLFGYTPKRPSGSQKALKGFASALDADAGSADSTEPTTNGSWLIASTSDAKTVVSSTFPWAEGKKVKSTGNFIKLLLYQKVIAITDIETGVQFACLAERKTRGF